MADGGLITKEEAIKRIDPAALDQLLHRPWIQMRPELAGQGVARITGRCQWQSRIFCTEAEELAALGEKTILVRVETSPEDIGGMHAAQGILTTRGGMTSHAAVVARGMGRPCVAGAGDIRVDYQAQKLTASGQTVNAGDIITIDGSRGDVMLGPVETIQPELTGDFGILMGWVDEVRTMGVRTNAETPEDAKTAVKFGAEGIGLCRTEPHVF